MKEVKDDGGPAFPSPETEERHPHFGMPLRDWFAGQALAGILADNSSVSSTILTIFGAPHLDRSDVAAMVAYKFADAMLKARSEVSS